jgi:hypothetical protein
MTAGGDRFFRRRLRARLVRYRVQLLVLLGLGVTGAVVWLVYFSTVLGVHRVEVEGNSLLSADQVEQAAGVELGSAWPAWTSTPWPSGWPALPRWRRWRWNEGGRAAWPSW